jgi:hypothetical protein
VRVGRGPEIPPEDPLVVLRRDAHSQVPHPEHHLRVPGLQRHLHRGARSVLGGVGQQVREHLLEPQGIPPPPDPGLRRLHPDRTAGALQALPAPLDHLLDQATQVQLPHRELQPAAADLRHVQQHLDQALQPLGLAHRGPQAVQHPGGAHPVRPPDERLQREEQPGDGRLQLVRRDGQELVAGAQGLAGFSVEPLAGGVGQLPLGHVHHRGHQPRGDALRTAQRVAADRQPGQQSMGQNRPNHHLVLGDAGLLAADGGALLQGERLACHVVDRQRLQRRPPSQERVHREPQQPSGGRVHRGDATVGTVEEHAVLQRVLPGADPPREDVQSFHRSGTKHARAGKQGECRGFRSGRTSGTGGKSSTHNGCAARPGQGRWSLYSARAGKNDSRPGGQSRSGPAAGVTGSSPVLATKPA